VQEACGIHRKYRAGLGGTGHSGVVHACRNDHGVVARQGPDVVGVFVAQKDVGDLVVEQLVLAATRALCTQCRIMPRTVRSGRL
jgi:hypothetical protein